MVSEGAVPWYLNSFVGSRVAYYFITGAQVRRDVLSPTDQWKKRGSIYGTNVHLKNRPQEA